MSRIKVINVYISDWVVEGEFIEDTQYFDTILFVCADLEDGRTLVHNVSFRDSGSAMRWSKDGLEAAKRLAQRVEEVGSINEDHWYFHDFFSHSLESRLGIEAEYENHARHGRFDEMTSPWFAEGHA
jgi:hypothetical protein